MVPVDAATVNADIEQVVAALTDLVRIRDFEVASVAPEPATVVTQLG